MNDTIKMNEYVKRTAWVCLSNNSVLQTLNQPALSNGFSGALSILRVARTITYLALLFPPPNIEFSPF